MGGNIAWNYAVDYPEKIEKLVLVDLWSTSYRPEMEERLTEVIKRFADTDNVEITQLIVSYELGSSPLDSNGNPNGQESVLGVDLDPGVPLGNGIFKTRFSGKLPQPPCNCWFYYRFGDSNCSGPTRPRSRRKRTWRKLFRYCDFAEP